MPKVLLLDGINSSAEEVFRRKNIVTQTKKNVLPQDLISLIEEKEFDGIVVRSKTKVTRDILELPSLKVVGRAGAGTDNIDVKAATENGVLVFNAPGGNSISVAEHVFGLMLSMTRRIPEANTTTHNGEWNKESLQGVEISGRTLGIVGAGNIGSLVAKRAAAFGMKILAHDPLLPSERKEALLNNVPEIEFVGLGEIIENADIVTLHIPPQNKYVLDADAFQKMKPGVYIINTSREGLIDKKALKEAIVDGRVAGAAFDVFDREKAKECGLYGMKEIILTPHIAASTPEAQNRVGIQVAEQVGDVLLNNGRASLAINQSSGQTSWRAQASLIM